MRMHSESELHRCGKMFGVLIVESQKSKEKSYLAAFSAKLDGSYYHEGFVGPVYEMTEEPVGHSKEESQRLQRLLFANYTFVNGRGENKNLLEIFKDEKVVSAEDWFSGKKSSFLPPSGAGECCAPKLLQYALTHGLEPVSLAEFWVGAPSKTEIRQEGAFYAPCSGKCVPILRHVLEGLEIEDWRLKIEDFNKPVIIYEDEWLMVVNKPAGLLSVPGKSDEPSVESLMDAKPAHRLDQDTSGLLVLAKTAEVYKELQSYFQRRDILKRYEAVCVKSERFKELKSERIKELKSEGEISLPLLPNPYDRPRQMVEMEHGKVAITKYVIRERRNDGTVLVDFYPLTGRTHQLRVHAAHPDGLNAPIVGDRLYGMSASLNDANGDAALNDKSRLMLHAAEISFIHPVTKEEMHFCIPSNF